MWSVPAAQSQSGAGDDAGEVGGGMEAHQCVDRSGLRKLVRHFASGSSPGIAMARIGYPVLCSAYIMTPSRIPPSFACSSAIQAHAVATDENPEDGATSRSGGWAQQAPQLPASRVASSGGGMAPRSACLSSLESMTSAIQERVAQALDHAAKCLPLCGLLDSRLDKTEQAAQIDYDGLGWARQATEVVAAGTRFNHGNRDGVPGGTGQSGHAGDAIWMTSDNHKEAAMGYAGDSRRILVLEAVMPLKLAVLDEVGDQVFNSKEWEDAARKHGLDGVKSRYGSFDEVMLFNRSKLRHADTILF